MSTIRDTQKSRVYKSEREALKPIQRQLDLSGAKLLVRQVWASKRVAENWPKAFSYRYQPRLADGSLGDWRCRPRVFLKQGTWSNGGATRITLSSSQGLRDWVVVHELAHTIHFRVQGRDEAGHGWQFCAIYLKLVLYFLGREAHDALKVAFKANKVRFRAPRKGKPLTPEQKQALALRLWAARAQQA